MTREQLSFLWEVQNKTLELGTCLSVAVCYSKNYLPPSQLWQSYQNREIDAVLPSCFQV